jgi:hypothetical protein
MARNTEGDLKNILGSLNIYNSGLKTWTDLQKYIAEKSNGKILPEDLNKIAADVLADTDPSIAKIREKILSFSEKSDKGNMIKQSVSLTDQNNIKKSGKWLESVYNESLKEGLSETDMANMLSVLSALPDTDIRKYVEELTGYSEELLTNWLKNLDLKKAGVKAPQDLILYLIRNKDKGLYPASTVFDALARMIAAKDIPAETIALQIITGKENYLWILWTVIGCGLLIVFILFWRRRKKDKK